MYLTKIEAYIEATSAIQELHIEITVTCTLLISFLTFQTPPPLFSTGMLRLALPFTGVGVSATSLRLPQIFRIT